jgi:D-aminopeptidase
VAETWDGELNDVNGFHVKPSHVDAALDGAAGGPVAEGNVGGGTGMTCHGFKCGIGTSSRRVDIEGREYVVGALVQANYGTRSSLRIAGVPVGQHLKETEPGKLSSSDADKGSIIIVVATDAPLLPNQLDRIAKRAGMGLAAWVPSRATVLATSSSRFRRRTRKPWTARKFTPRNSWITEIWTRCSKQPRRRPKKRS